MGDNQIKALHYFIKEATVGELNYILEDIGSIIGNKDFMANPEIVEALRGYYESHLTHQTLDDGTKVVVTQHGRRETEGHKEPEEDGEGDLPGDDNPTQFTYVDEARNTKFTLDVMTGECKVISNDEKHSDDTVQGFKESVVEALDKYISEFYKSLTTLGTVTIEGSDQVTAHIEISCHNLNHKNFWGGEWLSRWTVKHTPGDSSFELTGSIKIMNHYFEQGNIQFKLDKNYDTPTTGSITGDAGKSILDHIGKLEEEYQSGLEEMYEDISENHMKNLRRKLPITGKSFEWGVPKLM